MPRRPDQKGWPRSGANPAIWLLYTSRNPAAAHSKYSNRRLIEAACRIGLSADLVNSRELGRDARAAGPGSWPLAVLPRSGTQLGRVGKAVLAAATANGALALPSRATLMQAECKLSVSGHLARAGVPTPLCCEVTAETSTDWLGDRLGYPLVLKNARGSKGRLVRLCAGPQDYRACFAAVAGPGPIMAQHYVRASHGRDARVMVVGGTPVAAMLRRAPEGRFHANIHQGAEAFPTPMTSELSEIAIAAAAALRLDIAGVDILFGEEGLTVCEVNTAPGLEAIERVTGRDVAGAIMDLVVHRLGHQRLGHNRLDQGGDRALAGSNQI